MPAFEHQLGKFLFSDAKHRLDLCFIYNLLCTPSANSPGLPPSRFPIVVTNSLCIGVYDGKQQVGFGRIVTDYSEFAGIWDIYIDERYRGRGLGKELMHTIMNNPKIKGVYRWFLMTDDAHGLYEKFNFKRETFNPRIMMYINPNADE